MKYIVLPLLLLLLGACDDKPATPPPAASTEANNNDNPLLKLQDETVNKAETDINAALEKTQQALDNVDKQ